MLLFDFCCSSGFSNTIHSSAETLINQGEEIYSGNLLSNCMLVLAFFQKISRYPSEEDF
jgi:hypothetical protein